MFSCAKHIFLGVAADWEDRHFLNTTLGELWKRLTVYCRHRRKKMVDDLSLVLSYKKYVTKYFTSNTSRGILNKGSKRPKSMTIVSTARNVRCFS